MKNEKDRQIGFSLSGTILGSSLTNSGEDGIVTGGCSGQKDEESCCLKLSSRVMYKTLAI